MADNIDVTPGTGKTIAADEVAGALYQRVKLAVGADGAAADLAPGQALMAASLPVAIASNQSDINVSLDGETVELAASTAAIGKLAANSGVDIGDVDVTSIVPGTGTTNLGKTVDAIAAASETGVLALSHYDNGEGDSVGIIRTDLNGHLQVDVLTLGAEATVAVTGVLPGSGAYQLGKSVNTEHGEDDVGVLAFAVRKDSPAALADTSGDYAPLEVDAVGRLHTLISTPDSVITVTPTVDTSAYASGDLLFDSAEIANAVRANGGTAILQSVTILDKADQGVAFTLLFANAATDFGAANSAPDPDDTEAGTVIGHVPVAATDYVDVGASKIACIRNLGLLLQAGGATTSLYVAAINGTGTPTFGAAGDLVLQIGLLRS